MIFALAGVIVITAFAALIAQVSLLLRLRPWQAQPAVKPQAVPDSPLSYSTSRSPKRSVHEQEEGDVIDAEWWYETSQ
jgi:hypothetical protein